MKKWRGEEEEAEAGGETAIDKMKVAGDMGVTGVVVVSGYDDKNWWFLGFFVSFLYQPGLDLSAKHLIFAGKAKIVGYGPVLKAVRIKGGFGTGQFTNTKKIDRTDQYGMVLTSLTYVHGMNG